MEPSIPEAETVVELTPVPRIVGPGRRERAYLERVQRLETELRERAAALEAAALVERGSSRRLDRMERKLEAQREAAGALEQKERRLILALGALQRENEMLRQKLELSAGERRPRALPARKRSVFARLFRRA